MTALLTTKAVSVRFGGLTAVDAVDIAVPEGAIHGVIGPNGAGKTTLFNAITGLVQVTDGAVAFAGEDVTRRPAYRRARLGMRRTFQSVQLLPQLTVLENVLIGLHDHIRENTFLSLLSGRSLEEEEAQQRVDRNASLSRHWRHAVSPADRAFLRGAALCRDRARAGGQAASSDARRAGRGLEPAGSRCAQRAPARICAESGITILLVEHVLSLVLDVSQRITVLDGGRVIAEGTPAEVEADERVKAAYLGDEHA